MDRPSVTVRTRTVDDPRQDVGTCIVAGCDDFGSYVVTAEPAPRAWTHPLHCCAAHLEACIGLRLFDSGTEIKRRAQEAAARDEMRPLADAIRAAFAEEDDQR